MLWKTISKTILKHSWKAIFENYLSMSISKCKWWHPLIDKWDVSNMGKNKDYSYSQWWKGKWNDLFQTLNFYSTIGSSIKSFITRAALIRESNHYIVYNKRNLVRQTGYISHQDNCYYWLSYLVHYINVFRQFITDQLPNGFQRSVNFRTK